MKTILMLDAENVGWRHFECWAENNKEIVFSAEIRRAYGDFTSRLMQPWHRICEKYGITCVSAFHFNKNQADMHLSADALELLYDWGAQRLFLFSGDSDFIPMLNKFRAKGTTVEILAHSNYSAGLDALCPRVQVLAPSTDYQHRVPPTMGGASVVDRVLRMAGQPIYVATVAQKCRRIQPGFTVQSLGQPMLRFLQNDPRYNVWLVDGKGPSAWVVECKEGYFG